VPQASWRYDGSWYVRSSSFSVSRRLQAVYKAFLNFFRLLDAAESRESAIFFLQIYIISVLFYLFFFTYCRSKNERREYLARKGLTNTVLVDELVHSNCM
jgi:hypothetical protein